MNPVTGAAVTAYYSVVNNAGAWDGYCKISATPVDHIDVYYRILYHVVGDPPTTWTFQQDMPWERFFFGILTKFVHCTRDDAGLHRHQIVDKIRIETHDLTDDIPANTAIVDVTLTTNLFPTHVYASNFTYVCGGDVGATYGTVNLRWDDLTKFVSGGRILVTKTGLTSSAPQTVFDQSFSSMPFTHSPENSTPNFIQLVFKLLPAGIPVAYPSDWNELKPPTTDPDAPKWVAEGDLLTVNLSTNLVDDPLMGPQVLTTIYSFRYYHQARFFQFTDAATKNQPYTHQLEIIQDPWNARPIGGTFALVGATPPGVWTLSPAGLLQCPAPGPTTVGTFYIQVNLVSLGHAGSVEPITMVVNIEGLPKIMAPPQSLPLVLGLPYPPQYNLYATNHPVTNAGINAWRTSPPATPLPAGLSFDPNTGIISGTPTAEVLVPLNITFIAHNLVGDSAPYLTQWTVTSYETPTINSPTTLIAFLGDLVNYQITTNRNAIYWRAFDLPQGFILQGSVLTGTPTGMTGDFTIGLQAANRWGWGPVFPLQLTVKVAPPIISSPLEMEAFVDEAFSYQIAASHNPISYGATNLPIGLVCDAAFGLITGIPTAIGPYDNVHIIAANAGGFDDKILIINIVAPPVPVIDTTATHGRAITAESGIFYESIFTANASHSPTEWEWSALPDGITAATLPDPLGGGTSLRIGGTFQTGGLFSISLTAINNHGLGRSEEAVFYFLVTIGPVTAQEINTLGTIMEIWIDLNAATVGIGNTLTVSEETPTVPTGKVLNVKRGDTIELQVLFYAIDADGHGVPVHVNVNTLKLGIKAAFDDEFVVFMEQFQVIEGGRFKMVPDFSGTNDDLDAVLVDATTTLKGEIQWEMLDENNITIRRSTEIFDVKIMRDLIHPD
jgi:hypothetical protein